MIEQEVACEGDLSCTHRANGILNQSDYERLKLSSRTIEKLYIATMNYYYLMAVHELSLARIDSQSDSDDSLTPNEVKVIVKKSKFFQNDDRKLQNAREVGELISTFDQLSALYRKYMPAGAMKSPAWRASQEYLIASVVSLNRLDRVPFVRFRVFSGSCSVSKEERSTKTHQKPRNI